MVGTNEGAAEEGKETGDNPVDATASGATVDGWLPANVAIAAADGGAKR